MQTLKTKKKNLREFRCGKFLFELGKKTCVMGVLNVTPDSFSDGGKFLEIEKAISHAKEMAKVGADIVDVGGESTRPGASRVDIDTELKRTIPVIEALSEELDIPISIDTYKHEVADLALKAGAAIVNDISGLKFDPKLASVIARHGGGAILMHIKGTPREMQKNPVYKDLISEIKCSLKESIDIALKAGIKKDSIMVDPGIGFGKTVRDNLVILNRLDELKALGMPVLIGTSRKSFIGMTLSKDTNERIMGTAASSALAIMKGADAIRVHDVKEMRDVADMTDAIREEHVA